MHCPAKDSAPLALWRLSFSERPLVQAVGSFPVSAPLALWRLSFSERPRVQAVGSFPVSEVPWFCAMPPSLGRGRVTTTAKLKLETHYYVTKEVRKFRRS